MFRITIRTHAGEYNETVADWDELVRSFGLKSQYRVIIEHPLSPDATIDAVWEHAKEYTN